MLYSKFGAGIPAVCPHVLARRWHAEQEVLHELQVLEAQAGGGAAWAADLTLPPETSHRSILQYIITL